LTGIVFAGGGSLVAISPLGRRSGAHLNPAVTFAFWLERHVHPHDLAGYVVAQCTGAITGAAVVVLAWGSRAHSVSDGRTAPGAGIGPIGAAAIEAAMTAALVLTIFAMVSSKRTARWTPLAVWVLVAVLVWQVAPYTGTSLNPARSLGPDVVSGVFPALGTYLLGPLVGASGAVGVWQLVPRVTLTAKLFHDRWSPTTMRTLLPALPPAPR
jgi:aquaporin Z